MKNLILFILIFIIQSKNLFAQDLKESGWDNLIESSNESLVDPSTSSSSSSSSSTSRSSGQGSSGGVIYKYKESEKFDFSELVVGGDKGSPGDLSSVYRFQKKFNNKLPYKKSFLKEMISSVDRVL